MKTKSILLGLALAVLGASAWQASAQDVYSINVVGYYNVTVSTGWNLLANQLNQTNLNANYVLGGPPADGSLLYRYDPANQTYFDAATYVAQLGWYPKSGDLNDPVLDLPLGEGFFIWTPTNWIATFVGEVEQGSLINPLLANYSLKGSIVPQAGLLQTDLFFPPYAGDQVWRWVAAAFSPYTYDASNGAWVSSEPPLNVGEGFILYRSPAEATTNHWWARNFTVQDVPNPPLVTKFALQGANSTSPLRIRSLSLQQGDVVLDIQKASGAAYNVQFSTDRRSWQNAATNQTANLWQEPSRGGLQGFYQLVKNP